MKKINLEHGEKDVSLEHTGCLNTQALGYKINILLITALIHHFGSLMALMLFKTTRF
jgi:hypothetical protein